MRANTASASPARVKIAIVMGSKSDWATTQFAAEGLTMLDIRFHAEVISAYRTLKNCSVSPNKLAPTGLR
jgi:5-(carboxyamino)imidazole ribonucleotide mutase